MKLVQEDETKLLNGVSKQDVEEKEREVISANGDDLLCSDSQSNSDSLLCEDSLMKENGGKEGSQNGSGRPDDTRSWSSSSSILPSPAELEDEFSEDLRLQISEDEDEDPKSVPPDSTLEKDNPLPSIGESSFSDVKNPFRELLDDENGDTLQDTVKETSKHNEIVEESSSISAIKAANKLDNVCNINNESNIISDKKKIDGPSKLDDLIAEIVPDNKILNELSSKTDSDSVTDLRQEIEDVLKKGDDPKTESTEEISITGGKTVVDKIEETDDNMKETDDKMKETEDKIKEIVKIKDIEDKIEETEDKMEKTDDTIEKPDDKIDKPDDKIEKPDDKIDDNTNTEKENLSEEQIENDLLNMEVDEDPSVNSDSSIKESDIINNSGVTDSPDSPDTTLDLPEKEDQIEDSVLDGSKTLKNNDDTIENNLGTGDEIEEMSGKSFERPIVETTSTSEVSSNVEESMEVTETDNIEEIEKDINFSTTEEKAEIVLAETKGVPLNKSEEVFIKSSNVESTSTETKEMKEEETKKELVETPSETTKCLKRSLEDDDISTDTKKPKINGIIVDLPKKRDYVALDFLRDFMSKKDVKTMTRLELEELCLQKMCEVVNQTSKIGELHRTLKQQEQITEGLRIKYGGLKKQISDLTIVQTKIMQEMKSKLPEGLKDGATVRDLMPVKITRSVGLQVNLQAGMRAVRVQPNIEKIHSTPLTPVQKRKLQRPFLPNKSPATQKLVPSPTPAKPIGATIPKSPNLTTAQTTPKSGIKTILPKESSDPSATNSSLLSNYLLASPANSKSTPPPTGTRKAIAPTGNSSATATIDLTDDEDKTAVASSTPTSTAPSIRVVNHQLMGQVSTPTTKSVPITYLVSPNQSQQVILTSGNSATKPGQVRPSFMLRSVPGQVQQGLRLNIMRPTTPGTNQGVVLPSANSTVRHSQPVRIQQVTTTTTTSATRTQMASGRVTRHPAPLPGPPAVQPSQPTWKAMPPKPSLKISRVGDGIVLSWKMLNKNMSLYEDIASYQLYAYQETTSAPATEMWRKVGDVKALALPMACTLTQFTDGNKYHFAVRAVDVKSRVGPFSQPEQIALP